MDSLGFIVEYEDILLKKTQGFSTVYLKKDTQQKNIKALLRYIFESMLGWGPETTRDYLTESIVEKLHIRSLIRRLDFPSELNNERDLFYVSMALYPKEITFPKRTYILSIYQKVRDKKLVKFPKKFFLGSTGKLNCSICFRYALQQDMYADNLYDLYMFFADDKKGTDFIRDAMLYTPYHAYYETPIDMLYDCLPEEQQSELFYQLALFSREFAAKKGVALNAYQCKRERIGSQ